MISYPLTANLPFDFLIFFIYFDLFLEIEREVEMEGEGLRGREKKEGIKKGKVRVEN